MTANGTSAKSTVFTTMSEKVSEPDLKLLTDPPTDRIRKATRSTAPPYALRRYRPGLRSVKLVKHEIVSVEAADACARSMSHSTLSDKENRCTARDHISSRGQQSVVTARRRRIPRLISHARFANQSGKSRTSWFAADASRPGLAYDHRRLLIARAALPTSTSMRGSRHAACGVRSRISARVYPGIRLSPSGLSQPPPPQRDS